MPLLPPHPCEPTERSSGGWLGNDGKSNPQRLRAVAAAAVGPCGAEQPSAPGKERGTLNVALAMSASDLPIIELPSDLPVLALAVHSGDRGHCEHGNLPIVALVVRGHCERIILQ